jgi:hypothetical protein
MILALIRTLRFAYVAGLAYSTFVKQGQPNLSSEFALLCALAGTNLTSARRQQIADWNYSALEWNIFFQLADQHGVLPLAAHNLLEIDSAKPARSLPAEVESSLRSAYQANLRRSLWFSSELTRIVRHFQSKQLHAIPFKGPLLAQSLYADVALRQFSDLDFLISSAEFDSAKRALDEVGYRPSTQLTPEVERFWLRRGNERAFDGAAGKNLVELQWAVLPYFYAINLRVEDLLTRAKSTYVSESETGCLSSEDSLLVLCLHAAKHLWTRLIWLSDISETLRIDAIDYSLLFDRARTLGTTRILGVSFWLAQNVLEIELPQAAENLVHSDPSTVVIGSSFAERLARGAAYDFESADYFRLILKLRERRRDRWRYLWRLLWTPGAGDLDAVRLPGPFFPLYRIVRTGRLLRKLAR